MRVCIVSIFTNEVYRKLIRGWIENMNTYFLPKEEREWYLMTDDPDHPGFSCEKNVSPHLIRMERMSKFDVWRNKWRAAEEACDWAIEHGCTHFIFAQSNVRCCRLITKDLWDRRMEKATDGSPVSVRHMTGLRATEAQVGLFFGGVEKVKEFIHFWRGKVEDDEWWKEACKVGIFDEYELSSVYIPGELNGLVGYADSGFSHDLQSDGTWREVEGDTRDKVMCTVNKYTRFATISLRGGLGNNLFQLAYLIAFAKKNNFLPCISYAHLRKIFPSKTYYATARAFIDTSTITPAIVFSSLSLPVVVDEVATYEGDTDVEIYGYVQGENGFKSVAHEVKNCFSSLNLHPVEKRSIGIHIRGSDYVRSDFPTLTPEDVKNSLSLHLHQDKKLYIFTDDNPFAAGLISPILRELEDGYTSVTWIVGKREKEYRFRDLAKMMTMEVFICSASTYSWWAAYLGNAKVVFWPDTSGRGWIGDNFYRLRRPVWNLIEKGEPKEAELLVVVQSCRENLQKREACRITWLSRLPEGVEYVFAMGGKGPDGYSEDEPDTLVLQVKDDYFSLCDKSYEMFNYLSMTKRFRYILKCDDDSYVHLTRVRDMLRKEAPGFMSATGWFISGGAGYILRRDIFLRVVRYLSANLPRQYPEDAMVYKVTRQLGDIPLTRTDRFQRSKGIIPMKKNDQITCHYCKLLDMVTLDRILSEECLASGEYFREHGSKTVIAFFRSDGEQKWVTRFGHDNEGTWRLEDKTLTLTDVRGVNYILFHLGEGYWEGIGGLISTPILPSQLTNEG